MNFTDISKSAAQIFLYGVGFIMTGVLAYQMVSNANTNALAIGLVNIIIGYVINSVGVQHGVQVTNDTVQKTAIAQYPLTADGLAHSPGAQVTPGGAPTPVQPH